MCGDCPLLYLTPSNEVKRYACFPQSETLTVIPRESGKDFHRILICVCFHCRCVRCVILYQQWVGVTDTIHSHFPTADFSFIVERVYNGSAFLVHFLGVFATLIVCVANNDEVADSVAQPK